MYFVSYVGFGQLYLTWFCFLPALWAMRDVTPKRAALIGFVFFSVTTCGGFYWVAHLLHEFAGLNWFLAFLGLFLMCAWQGLSNAILFGGMKLAERELRIPFVWSLAIGLTAVEFLWPVLFPYYIGASQYKFVAITQIAEVFGALGLTLLIALVNGGFYELLSSRLEKRPVVHLRWAVPLAAFAAALIYGAIRIPQVDAITAAAPKLKVAMIQTNLGAKDKAEKSSEFIRRHLSMSKEVSAAHPDLDLIVWPESAYNRWIPRTTRNVSRIVTKGLDKPVLFGALTWEPAEKGSDGETNAYNSAVLTSSTGDVLGTFDKVVLLAFGETVPFIDTFPQIKKWFPKTGTFTRGKSLEHLVMRDGTTLLPMICYEDIIPAFVRALWKKAGPAHILVNVTNDSWYGDSHEPIEHLALAVFRTIETRRAMIRSTNTGISAFIDPAGRLMQRSGQWTQETLVGEVPRIDGGDTPYLVIGDLLGWLAGAGFAVLLVLSFRARRRRR